jgi:hypothetical protein
MTSYVYSEAAEKALLRKQDIRIVPLSAAIILLGNLDRSNIGEKHSCDHETMLTCILGNAKILNSETHNDLLSETHMTALQYTCVVAVLSNCLLPTLSPRIALMVFLIAYALFEVPSNYLLKRLSPSVSRC